MPQSIRPLDPSTMQYRGPYVSYYQAYEGDSLQTLALSSYYERQDPLQRLIANIKHTPNSVERGKAFLLLEYLQDHLFLSADVETPMRLAMTNIETVLAEEGFPYIYAVCVPLDPPGIICTDGQKAFNFLVQTSRHLITMAHQLEATAHYTQGKLDHPAKPTLEALRLLLKEGVRLDRWLRAPKSLTDALPEWRLSDKKEVFI